MHSDMLKQKALRPIKQGLLSLLSVVFQKANIYWMDTKASNQHLLSLQTSVVTMWLKLLICTPLQNTSPVSTEKGNIALKETETFS